MSPVAEIVRKFDPDYSTRWLSGIESTYQCTRCRTCWFDPWVGKIPWRGKWQPAPAWKIPWTEEAAGLQSMGSQESDMTEHTHTQQ